MNTTTDTTAIAIARHAWCCNQLATAIDRLTTATETGDRTDIRRARHELRFAEHQLDQSATILAEAIACTECDCHDYTTATWAVDDCECDCHT